jgi:hypothetical protein
MPGDTGHDYEVRESINRVVDASRKLLDTDERPVRRGQHPKQHGCVRARFIVARNLEDAYRQGLFQEEKVYDAWIRFSNGRQQDDRQPDAHGMAVKLMGILGPKVLTSERDATTHDFVMVDNPTFFLRGAVEYGHFSEMLEKAAGKMPSSLYRFLGFFMGGRARSLGTTLLLSLYQGHFPTFLRLIKFASKRIANTLTTRYWSTTPYKFGDTCVKFSAVPAEFPGGPRGDGPTDDSYAALADFLEPAVAVRPVAALSVGDSPDYLRQALSRSLNLQGAVFLFQVQLFKGDATTPINDPTVEWPDDAAPFHTVARIWIPKQVFDTSARMAFGESLSFTPWHAIAAHEPLGEINAVRKDVYAKLSALRHRLNGLEVREPNADDPDPDGLPPRWGVDSSAFCNVLQAELDLIRERRRRVQNLSVDGNDDRNRRLSAVGAPERGELDTDGQLGTSGGDAGAVTAAANDVDSLTRQARLRAATERTTGLALAGDGRRSASIAVGFLQGLASLGLVRHLDYLSGVSGGGHAAAWLSAWIKRDGGNLENIERQLTPIRIDEARAARQYLAPGEVVDEQPEPMRHLRMYTSSLGSGAGIVTTEGWIRILIWARNLIIHLLLLLPSLVLVVAGARLIVALYGLLGRLSQVDQLAAQFDSRLGGPVFVVGVLTLGFMFLAGAVALGWALSALVGSRHDSRKPDLRAREQIVTNDAVTRINGRIVGRLIGAVLLLSLCVPPIWRGLEEQVAKLSFGPNSGGLFSLTTLVDVVRAHLTLLGWPNFLAHALFVGGLFVLWSSRRSAGVEPARKKQFVRAAFAAGASGGLLIVLLEALFHSLVQSQRFDLVATLLPALALLIVVAALIVEAAVVGRAACDRERFWWAAVSALLTKRAIYWAAGMAMILYLPGLIFAAGGLARVGAAVAWLGAGAFAVLAGRNFVRSLNRAFGGRLLWLAQVAAQLFLAGLLAVAALVVSLIANMPSLTAPGGDDTGPFAYYLRGVEGTSTVALLGIAAGFVILLALGRRLIDVNLFSLDALKASLLTRCYLGASRPMPAWAARWSPPRDQRDRTGAPSLADPARQPALPVRNPDPLTGIDSSDDLDLNALRIGSPSDHDRIYWGPHLLLNATRKNTAESGAIGADDGEEESFFLSPLYCGCQSTGYARTENSRPAGAAEPNLSLGQAMAISGADNGQGRGSLRPSPLAALLTILCARPGWWIEKPKIDGWAADQPSYGDLPLSAAFGLGGGGGDFVYLSGGAEFDRLGVYELVRRRCRHMIAVDSGPGGAAFDSGLATLIRRCRIDFGVRIEITNATIPAAGAESLECASIAVGRVHYGDVDPGATPGVLLYIRLSLAGDELPETAPISGSDRRSTQRPSGSEHAVEDRRFECYRWLGERTARVIFGDVVARVGETRCGLAAESPAEYAPRLFAAVVERYTGGENRETPSLESVNR